MRMLRTCLLYVARADARRGAAASEEKQATCEDGESPMAVDSGEYAPPYEIVGPRHQILVHTRMVRILFATSSTDTSTSSVSSHSGFTLAMTTRDLLFFRESPFEVVPRTQLFLRSSSNIHTSLRFPQFRTGTGQKTEIPHPLSPLGQPGSLELRQLNVEASEKPPQGQEEGEGRRRRRMVLRKRT